MIDEQYKVLDNIPVGICILNRDHRVLFWNKCLEDWCGISKEEIMHSEFGFYFPNFKDERYRSRIDNIFDGAAPTIFSPQLHGNLLHLYFPNGEPRIQQITVMAVPTPDGDFNALFSVEDVTVFISRSSL